MSELEKHESKMQLNYYYLFHVNLGSYYIKEISEPITPTMEKIHKFLYHENMDIVNSYFENLRTEPIIVHLERLSKLNTKPNEALRLTLYPEPSEIEHPFPKTANTLGKWMMFFKKTIDFDQKWSEYCQLYDEHKLHGIVALMCTTNSTNKNHDDTIGVIFFHCDSNDLSTLANYGINLLSYTKVASGARDENYLYYKKYDDYDIENNCNGKSWSFKMNVNSYKITMCEPIFLKLTNNNF